MSILVTVKIESIAFDRTATAIERLATVFERLLALVDVPPMPPIFSVLVTSQGTDSMLNFSIVGMTLPGAPDVVSRELSVKVGAADAVVQSIAVDATEISGFSGADNDAVSVSLTDIDDAGNRSEPRVLEFTLTDTIAPPQPGEFAARVDSET